MRVGNGGWMRFNFPRAFTDQGDCIKFVNKSINIPAIVVKPPGP